MLINTKNENIYKLIDIFYGCTIENEIALKEAEKIFTYLPDKLEKTNFLDLGFGTGCITIPISRKYECSFGIDNDKRAHKVATLKINKDIDERLKLLKLDWRKLESAFSLDQFDLILSWGNSLIYTSSWNDKNFNADIAKDEIIITIEQIFNILKPGGIFLLQTLTDEESANKNNHIKKYWIDNCQSSFELNWDIKYRRNIRTNYCLRKVFKNGNLVSQYQAEFAGLAIGSSEIIDILSKVGFSSITKSLDEDNNYDIILAKK